MTDALQATPAVLEPVSPGDPNQGDPNRPRVRRVVLLDPRPERRAITRLLIERCAGLAVVGLAASFAEAAEQIAAGDAEIVLLEIQMPVDAGLAAIAALRDRFVDIQIVVSSFHSDPTTREAACAVGADAYLTKPLDVADLLARVVASPRSSPHSSGSHP